MVQKRVQAALTGKSPASTGVIPPGSCCCGIWSAPVVWPLTYIRACFMDHLSCLQLRCLSTICSVLFLTVYLWPMLAVPLRGILAKFAFQAGLHINPCLLGALYVLPASALARGGA